MAKLNITATRSQFFLEYNPTIWLVYLQAGRSLVLSLTFWPISLNVSFIVFITTAIFFLSVNTQLPGIYIYLPDCYCYHPGPAVAVASKINTYTDVLMSLLLPCLQYAFHLNVTVNVLCNSLPSGVACLDKLINNWTKLVKTGYIWCSFLEEVFDV